MFRPLEFFIGFRYIRAKRRNHFISFISVISVLGIALGVATLITVISVMNGFETELRARILGMASHATLGRYGEPMPEWDTLLETAQAHKDVIGAAPYVEGQVMLMHGRRSSGSLIRGVVPDYEKTVSEVADKIKSGRFQSLQAGEYGIILGKDLAIALNARLGDKVTVVTPQVNNSPVGVLPRLKRFTVVGTFEIGMFEYDRSLAFMHVVDASKLMRMREGVSGIRLKLQDMFEVQDVISDLREMLGNDYWLKSWMQVHPNFFNAVQMERRVMSIILALILTVAAFNIVSTLVMVVTDKQSDIAILRTLGASPGSIMKIFMVQGTLIGMVGALVGMGTGVLLALNVETIVPFIEELLGRKFLSADVYYINDLPSDLRWPDVAMTGLLSFILSVLATLYPAWRASKTHPAEALRYE